LAARAHCWLMVNLLSTQVEGLRAGCDGQIHGGLRRVGNRETHGSHAVGSSMVRPGRNGPGEERGTLQCGTTTEIRWRLSSGTVVITCSHNA